MTGPLVLLDDERAYWDRYVRSLTAPGVPAFTPDPRLTAAVLTAVGLPVTVPADAPPRGHGDPGGRTGLEGLGAELARLHADHDPDRAAGVEARLRAPASTPPRPADWVVGAGGGMALGLVRAVADGRPFLAVESLADPRVAALAERAASLFVVTDRADPEAMSRLQREADAAATRELLPGVRGCPVGFLHGRDFAAMTVLDAKQRRPAHPWPEPVRDVLIDSTVSDAPARAGAGLVTAPYRQVGRETIEGLERIRLLAITSHGMSDQVHLNSDYLCGRSPYLDLARPPGERLPSCTMADGATCYFKPEGRPLPVHRIPAEHVFVNSCGSLSFEETDFHPLFAIWYSAMDGRARSFAGTIRWKDGHGLEGLLYRNLLRAGHPLGAAIGLLNRALPGNQLEGGDVYFLLGDPADRLVGRADRVGPEVLQLRRGRNAVTLAGGFAHATLRCPDLVAAAHRAELHVRTDGAYGAADGAVYASTVPTSDGAAVHVLLSSGHHDGELVVDVGDLRHEHDTMLAVSEALDQTLAPVLGMHGLYPDQVRQGGRKNLEGRLLQLSRLYKARFTEPAAARRLVRSTETLLRELDRTDERIARWLQDRIRTTSYRFSEHYQDNFLLAGAEPDSACYQCGRTLTRRELHHILRPTVRRTEFICARCGSIADTPDPSLALIVDLPDTIRRGEKATTAVRLDNRSGRPHAGYCLAAVRKSAGAGIEQPHAVHAVTVPAGGSATVEFDLVLADTTPVHQYDLQAAFVSTTRIHLGRRAFWVVER